MLNNMNLEELYRRIIPPDDYQHRKDFHNEEILDRLDEKQKLAIEKMLIRDLMKKCDVLIIESLAYLKSKQSINVIENHLKESKDPHDKIIIAWCLYSLDKDREKMVDIAHRSFLLIENNYTKTYLFYYLAMNSFKVFVIPCKIAILLPYFVFFLLRSAAMQLKKAFIWAQKPGFSAE